MTNNDLESCCKGASDLHKRKVCQLVARRDRAKEEMERCTADMQRLLAHSEGVAMQLQQSITSLECCDDLESRGRLAFALRYMHTLEEEQASLGGIITKALETSQTYMAGNMQQEAPSDSEDMVYEDYYSDHVYDYATSDEDDAEL